MPYPLSNDRRQYLILEDLAHPAEVARSAVEHATLWSSDREDAFQEVMEHFIRTGEISFAIASRVIAAFKLRATRERGGSQVTFLGLTPMDAHRESVTQRPAEDEDAEKKADAMLEALATLDEATRRTVRRRYGLGCMAWSAETIARSEAVSISTVERRLAKARRVMAEVLA